MFFYKNKFQNTIAYKIPMKKNSTLFPSFPSFLTSFLRASHFLRIEWFLFISKFTSTIKARIVLGADLNSAIISNLCFQKFVPIPASKKKKGFWIILTSIFISFLTVFSDFVKLHFTLFSTASSAWSGNPFFSSHFSPPSFEYLLIFYVLFVWKRLTSILIILIWPGRLICTSCSIPLALSRSGNKMPWKNDEVWNADSPI